MRPTAYDVFVSHSHKDKAEVDGIIHCLEAEGIRCWVAPRDIVPGTNWGESIIRGLESCSILLLVLSRDSNGSRQILHEVERAVAKGLIVVPFRIQDIAVSTQLELYVHAIHWLDAFTGPMEEHALELAGVLRRVLPPPSAARQTSTVRRRSPRNLHGNRPPVRRAPLWVGLALAATALVFSTWKFGPWGSEQSKAPGPPAAAQVNPGPPSVVPAQIVSREAGPLDLLDEDRAEAVRLGLAWLTAHQSDDGSWDCDGFSANCGEIGNTTCGGPGSAVHDVGVTGLALLAFLGAGNNILQGEHQEVVTHGIPWLKDQQDPDTGLFGERHSHDFIYDHAIATLAMCEAYSSSKSPLIKGTAQKAINLIFRARNPYGAWRYDIPPVGDSDTSVTGWMVSALVTAEKAGLEGNFKGAYEGALSFLDEVSDPASGRVGYSHFGQLSSRTPANEHYPREKGEAMTAVGLLCRIFLGQKPEEFPIMNKHAELIRSKPPVWDPEGFGSDMYYWYYGTCALYRMGKPYWPVWEKAMKAALVDSQRKDGDEKGSWDPECAWGFSGGRVYSTALAVLALTTPVR